MRQDPVCGGRNLVLFLYERTWPPTKIRPYALQSIRPYPGHPSYPWSLPLM